MIYRNKNFTKRDYECTNIVACIADDVWLDRRPCGFRHMDAMGRHHFRLSDIGECRTELARLVLMAAQPIEELRKLRLLGDATNGAGSTSDGTLNGPCS